MEPGPNGVAVRGLHVLHTVEDGRHPTWWMWVLSLLFQDLIFSTHWHVVTVRSGSHNPVARRQFAREAQAHDARKRFAQTVADMSPDAYEHSDWQALLDSM